MTFSTAFENIPASHFARGFAWKTSIFVRYFSRNAIATAGGTLSGTFVPASVKVMNSFLRPPFMTGRGTEAWKYDELQNLSYPLNAISARTASDHSRLAGLIRISNTNVTAGPSLSSSFFSNRSAAPVPETPDSELQDHSANCAAVIDSTDSFSGKFANFALNSSMSAISGGSSDKGSADESFPRTISWTDCESTSSSNSSWVTVPLTSQPKSTESSTEPLTESADISLSRYASKSTSMSSSFWSGAIVEIRSDDRFPYATVSEGFPEGEFIR